MPRLWTEMCARIAHAFARGPVRNWVLHGASAAGHHVRHPRAVLGDVQGRGAARRTRVSGARGFGP
jgi:hypothetical protein